MHFYSACLHQAREDFSKFPYFEIKGCLRLAFTGTRINGLSACVAGIVANSLRYTLSGTDYTVSVGDASGVDAEVIDNIIQQPYQVFRVQGQERRDFAQRSVRCLESILPKTDAVVLAFPASKCPARVDTKQRFAGHGSGTWGTVGLALSHGLKVIMYVPPREDPLKWCSSLKQYATVLTPVKSGSGTWVKLNRTIQSQITLF